jgi:drug/metabolite transporter (DMT)-like permease
MAIKPQMLSAILASGSSLAWGSADFLAGVSCRRLGVVTVLFVSQLIGAIVLLPMLTASGAGVPALSYIALGALAGVFNAAALTAFYRGLARGPISLVAAIAATEAIIPVTWGLAHGDRPSAVVIVGIGLALVGVVVASGAVRDPAHGRQARFEIDKLLGEYPHLAEQLAALSAWRDSVMGRRAKRPRFSSASTAGLGVIAAVCFGLFVVAFKGASHGGALWAAALSRACTISLLLAVLPLARDRFTLRLSSSDATALVAIGSLDVLANVLLAFASRSGALSVIGPLSSFYPVVTILLAGVVLRERLDPLQRLGTIGALAGAALLTVR